jgi:hypothetical protein
MNWMEGGVAARAGRGTTGWLVAAAAGAAGTGGEAAFSPSHPVVGVSPM